MKLIDEKLVQKVQEIIVKGKHPDYAWKEVNDALFSLHNLEAIETKEPQHADSWEAMESKDISLGKQNDSGKQGNT